MSEKKKLVEVKEVSVSYRRGKPALTDVSFDIRAGELVSLIGLNGSGKSTLLHSLVGLVKPSSGKIIKHTDKIFFIPQRSDLDTTFPITVEEFCELFGKKGYEKYLMEVQVDGLINRKVDDLSGGELQRVLLALALSRKPKLLLLDEPTSGIDLIGESSFYKLIEDIRKDYDVAIVLVSHDIHLVMRHADKVLCLSGHVCCQGTPEEVGASEDFKSLFGKHLTPYVHKHDHDHI